MHQENIDIIRLHEMIRQDFPRWNLKRYVRWVVRFGLDLGVQIIRGMLLGFTDECFEVGRWRKGTFFLSADV
jgi:hypothetical protein